jgi:hypothetical protein
VSFVDIAILRFLLFALMKAFQDRRAPWYQRGLIRNPLRKISVIMLHDVERRIGRPSQQCGFIEQPIHSGLFESGPEFPRPQIDRTKEIAATNNDLVVHAGRSRLQCDLGRGFARLQLGPIASRGDRDVEFTAGSEQRQKCRSEEPRRLAGPTTRDHRDGDETFVDESRAGRNYFESFSAGFIVVLRLQNASIAQNE